MPKAATTSHPKPSGIAAAAIVKSAPKVPTYEWDGKKITKPGVYSRVPLDLYHKADICDGPSLSASRLKWLNPDVGSPAHFYTNWPGNPRYVEGDESKAMILGRAAHHLLLGEKFFANLFVLQPAEYVHHETGEV